MRRSWWRGLLARGVQKSSESLTEVLVRGGEIQSWTDAGLWERKRGVALSERCAKTR
jgi:hypothetical protein